MGSISKGLSSCNGERDQACQPASLLEDAVQSAVEGADSNPANSTRLDALKQADDSGAISGGLDAADAIQANEFVEQWTKETFHRYLRACLNRIISNIELVSEAADLGLCCRGLEQVCQALDSSSDSDDRFRMGLSGDFVNEELQAALELCATGEYTVNVLEANWREKIFQRHMLTCLNHIVSNIELIEDSADVGICCRWLERISDAFDAENIIDFRMGLVGDWRNDELEAALGLEDSQ